MEQVQLPRKIKKFGISEQLKFMITIEYKDFGYVLYYGLSERGVKH